MRLAIFGDSFGVSKCEDSFANWTSLLAQSHDVTNFCQCGASEYRILNQIEKASLDDFDRLIITHTSPSRIFVKHNPLHADSKYHRDCDIIVADIATRNDEFSRACQSFFKHIYDDEYQITIHNLLCARIENLCGDRALHISHFDYAGLHRFVDFLDFYPLWSQHRGAVSHYDQFGNQSVYQRIQQVLEHA